MPSKNDTAAYRAALAAAGRVSATAFGPEARRRAELRRPIYRSLPSADAMARGFIDGEVLPGDDVPADRDEQAEELRRTAATRRSHGLPNVARGVVARSRASNAAEE